MLISLIPNADSLRSPKLLLLDLNVFPPVCALTRDIKIPDRCRRGVGGGGIGRAPEVPVGTAESDSGGDSGMGEMGVVCEVVWCWDANPDSRLAFVILSISFWLGGGNDKGSGFSARSIEGSS